MTTETNEKPVTWTWADQVSSWRFWGLLISYLLAVSFGDQVVSLFRLGLASEEYRRMLSVHFVATGFGVYLAWVAIKWRPVISLIILAFLKVAGLLLLHNGDTPLWLMSIGWFFVGLSTGAISLAVPAIIAGGRYGGEAFLVAFGIVTTFGRIVSYYAFDWVVDCIEAFGEGYRVYVAVAPVVAGALILLTVKAELFNGNPPVRGYTLTPIKREPVNVGLLFFFVPFYKSFWLYRAHGEVATVAPSRTLLSPRAALFGSLFVPFLYAMTMASLVDALNQKHQELGRPKFRSPISIFFWAIFFCPMAGAMIQSGINGLLASRKAPPIFGANPGAIIQSGAFPTRGPA